MADESALRNTEWSERKKLQKISVATAQMVLIELNCTMHLHIHISVDVFWQVQYAVAWVVDCSGCCHFMQCPYAANTNFTVLPYEHQFYRTTFFNWIFFRSYRSLYFGILHVADITTCSLLLDLCHVAYTIQKGWTEKSYEMYKY